jgi:hypothetical protein
VSSAQGLIRCWHTPVMQLVAQPAPQPRHHHL